MALRPAQRPATLKARLNRLERELHPFETDEQRYSRALLTYWLATSEDAATLLVEYEDARQRHGGITALLASEAGRDLTLRLLDDLYSDPERQS